LDWVPGFEGEGMKQKQSRETMPLWVWLAFAAMVIVVGAYLTGYRMVEEIISHKK
jgi:phosphate/sulfate permease